MTKTNGATGACADWRKAMKKRIYTHEELVQKLEKAQIEIKRLKSRPNFGHMIKEMSIENQRLREAYETMAKQRDELWKCLKLRLEADGLMPPNAGHEARQQQKGR